MSYRCPACGAVSHHPVDEAFGYCAGCGSFTGDRRQRLAYLRAVVMSEAPLRDAAESVVEGLLAELAPLSPDEPLPELIEEDGRPLFDPRDVAGLTVADLRRRLRHALEDLAEMERRR